MNLSSPPLANKSGTELNRCDDDGDASRQQTNQVQQVSARERRRRAGAEKPKSLTRFGRLGEGGIWTIRFERD